MEPLQPGALFQGRFQIERALGEGGMGRVWAARDTRLERPVAIKVIHAWLAADRQYAERFLRETRAVARLSHPNIVQLYDAGATADGRLYMIMELGRGASLRERLSGGRRMKPPAAIHCASQIAEALGAAHAAGLVHRDVKPENILVSGEGVARLLDFGVAKEMGGAALTAQGMVIGTARYMAPEQVGGQVDGRADLYSLGVVLYEMAAGAHPYPVLDGGTGIGETETHAAHAHLAATPLPEVVAGCPAGLWEVVQKCLAKRPEERFARAEELVEALRGVVQSALREAALAETEPARPGVTPAPLPPPPAALERMRMAQVYHVTPGGLVPVTEPAQKPAAGASAEVTAPWEGPGPIAGSAAPLARTELWNGAAERAQVEVRRAGSRRAVWWLVVAAMVLGFVAGAVGWVVWAG